MTAVQQVLAWLAGTCAVWVVGWFLVGWVQAAPEVENWTDERTWGMRCEP